MRVTRVTVWCGCLVALLGTADVVRAEQASAASARELMQVSGAGALGEQAFAQILQQLKGTARGVPDSFWEEVSAEIDADGLMELVAPIYQEHFSEAEIRQLIAFYQSPIGKKLVEKQPLILTQSMRAGEQWGQQVASEVLDKMRARQAKAKSDGAEEAETD